MAKKPDELLALVKPWGLEKETKRFMAKYLKGSSNTTDVDSWIRDRRTAEQFAEQMKAYWAVEDAFALWLENNLKRKYSKVSVERMGTDKAREIVQGQSPRGKVTGEPDYLVNFHDSSEPISVEFQFAAVELDAYDVKKNKVNKIEKLNGIILFAFLPKLKFTLMNASFVKAHGKDFINPRIGGKNTWNIPAEKIVTKDKDYQISKEDLQRGF